MTRRKTRPPDDAFGRMLLDSREELAKLLQNTGWRIERFHDAENGPTYVAVLCKDKQGA